MKSKLAITSFCLSFVPFYFLAEMAQILPNYMVPPMTNSLFLIFLLLSAPISIILGVIALRKINKNNELTGKRFAKAGIIISSIYIMIFLLLFVIFARI